MSHSRCGWAGSTCRLCASMCGTRPAGSLSMFLRRRWNSSRQTADASCLPVQPRCAWGSHYRITTLAGGARFDGRTLHLAGARWSDEGRSSAWLALSRSSRMTRRSISAWMERATSRALRGGAWPTPTRRAARSRSRAACRPDGRHRRGDRTLTSPRITWQQITSRTWRRMRARHPEALTVKRAASANRGRAFAEGSCRDSDGVVAPALVTRRRLPADVGQSVTDRVRVDASIQLENRPTPFIPSPCPANRGSVLPKRAWRVDGQHRRRRRCAGDDCTAGRLADDLRVQR